MSRRTFLRCLGIGTGAIAVVAVAGAGWRIVDQRILAPESGAAYDAWRARLTGDGPHSLDGPNLTEVVFSKMGWR